MRYLTYICLFSLLCLNALAQKRHVVAFYNVENLFDTINSPATADEDMLPLSDRRWDTERYEAKLKNISQILLDITSQHDYPTLIGVAEVENRSVVEDLIREPALAAAHYNICHYDSPDERGIDVALLYRPEKIKILGSKAIPATADNPTRDILTVWGELDNEPIFIAVVHWPSRIGGVKFTEPQRIACAQQLREIVDSVQCHTPATKIIIMGDMNDNPHDRSIAEVLRAKSNVNKLLPNDLYAPFANVKRGSSVYDNRWNRYDNIIVSGNIVQGNGFRLCPIGKRYGAIFSRKDMLDKHGYPKPTFKGDEYIGGASDHLPIYILLGK